MGVINIPRTEQDALLKIAPEVLRKLIEDCLHDESTLALRELRLNECGPFVATKHDVFNRTLDAYSKAKSDKKRADTLRDAARAGSYLLNAVQQMQHRMATEAEEGKRFYVDDLITPPTDFGMRLSVCVRYRWRSTPAEPWVHGDITFLYDVDQKLDLMRPTTTRQKSTKRASGKCDEASYREWEHLKNQALFSVRDFFRDGGKGTDVPKTFEVRRHADSHGIKNKSTKFWLDRA